MKYKEVIIGIVSVIIGLISIRSSSMVEATDSLPLILTVSLIIIITIINIIMYVIRLLNVDKKIVKNIIFDIVGLLVSMITIITIIIIITNIIKSNNSYNGYDSMGILHLGKIEYLNKVINSLAISGICVIINGILLIILAICNIDNLKNKFINKSKLTNNESKLLDIYINDRKNYEKLLHNDMINQKTDQRIKELYKDIEKKGNEKSIYYLYENKPDVFKKMIEINYFSLEEIRNFEKKTGKKIETIIKKNEKR